MTWDEGTLKTPTGAGFATLEVLTFAGDKISKAEVYFGWDLSDRAGSDSYSKLICVALPWQSLSRACSTSRPSVGTRRR